MNGDVVCESLTEAESPLEKTLNLRSREKLLGFSPFCNKKGMICNVGANDGDLLSVTLQADSLTILTLATKIK